MTLRWYAVSGEHHQETHGVQDHGDDEKRMLAPLAVSLCGR
jgi:hypothetical protein